MSRFINSPMLNGLPLTLLVSILVSLFVEDNTTESQEKNQDHMISGVAPVSKSPTESIFRYQAIEPCSFTFTDVTKYHPFQLHT